MLAFEEANRAKRVQDALDAMNAADALDAKAIFDAETVFDTLARSVSSATHYELVGGTGKWLRKPIDLDNPVAWQDAPDDQKSSSPFVGRIQKGPRMPFYLQNQAASQTAPDSKKNLSIYQAVQVATGHILHYKSLFKADGYSLGDLIYSLPLAPGQKKEIVVIDSTHTLLGTESQSLSQGERLAAGIANERDITNQLGGNITESLRGSSSANTSGISAGFGTGGSGSGGTPAFGGSGSAVLGVAGGTANSNSTASQDSSRDVSQFFGEKFRQSHHAKCRKLPAAQCLGRDHRSRRATVQRDQRSCGQSQPLPRLDYDVFRGVAALRHIPEIVLGRGVRIRASVDDEFYNSEYLQVARRVGEISLADGLGNLFATFQFRSGFRSTTPLAESVRRQ